ncbi:unnamed protein product [Ilex paraguariensis]|uniref:Uncharacterized protein n=1 Tax=Ilex paraguariensis TaxID=185542 RepID=A0ABC8UMT0_9AQUA
MMLIQTSLPSSIEAAHSFVPNYGTKEFSCDWMPGAETWEKCPKCDKHPQGDRGQAVPVVEGEKSDIDSIPEKEAPKNTVAVCQALSSANTRQSDGHVSAISLDAPSVAVKERLVEVETEAVRSSAFLSSERKSRALVSNSESFNGCTAVKEPGSEAALRSDMHKDLDSGCMNDICSSSKSNIDIGLACLRTEVDDAGECSSSGALITEGLWDDMSEKKICISILRSEGLLGGVRTIRTCASAGGTSISNVSCFSRSCKVCDISESTLKMLICDNCDEAFHVSCCYPRISKIPVDEWFCHSCLKKKHKILKEKTSKSLIISNEMGRCRNATSKGELGPIAFMVRDTLPYATSVRIGDEHQAEVPDWSGPIFHEIDPPSEPLEMKPSECVLLHELSSNKPSRLSSIGNWLQCREVIEGVDGTVCGKWRRAPLFEVQTDDWECFRSVLWDPAHADCAVPQELDTGEVLKQLKYIEMLRPRLAAKRRKLDHTKTVGSQVLTEDVTSIHNQ